MLLVKLRYFDAWTEKRRANARFYCDRLRGISQIQVPDELPDTRCVYHTFIIQADQRDALREYLLARGIETQIHYPKPIHLQSCASDLGYDAGSFPVAERQAGRILSLPVYPELTEAQLEAVADGIRRFYDN
jgi:dTDP-4-amino-4,6-dideoxygalactose transaminase